MIFLLARLGPERCSADTDSHFQLLTFRSGERTMCSTFRSEALAIITASSLAAPPKDDGEFFAPTLAPKSVARIRLGYVAFATRKQATVTAIHAHMHQYNSA